MASSWTGSTVRRARARIRSRGRFQPCWRCGREMDLDEDPWHAGHTVDRIDGGTEWQTEAECPRCNLRAGGQRGAAIVHARRADKPTATMSPEGDRRIRPRW